MEIIDGFIYTYARLTCRDAYDEKYTNNTCVNYFYVFILEFFFTFHINFKRNRGEPKFKKKGGGARKPLRDGFDENM